MSDLSELMQEFYSETGQPPVKWYVKESGYEDCLPTFEYIQWLEDKISGEESDSQTHCGKIYCGNAKLFKSAKYGSHYQANICLDNIPYEHIIKHRNGKRYVNLKIGKLKEKGMYGDTHYVQVVTWMKDNGKRDKSDLYEKLGDPVFDNTYKEDKRTKAQQKQARYDYREKIIEEQRNE